MLCDRKLGSRLMAGHSAHHHLCCTKAIPDPTIILKTYVPSAVIGDQVDEMLEGRSKSCVTGPPSLSAVKTRDPMLLLVGCKTQLP